MDEKTKKFFQEKVNLNNDPQNETVRMLKIQFEKYDTVLKQIGYELCKLNQDNVILKAKVEKLEIKHLIGSNHTMRNEI